MPQIQSITSRDNPLLQRLRKLAADPSAYRKLGELWVEGDHLCSACLQRQQVVPVAVITDTAWNGLGGLAPAHDMAAHQLSLLAVQAERVIVVPEALFKGFSVLESPGPAGFFAQSPGRCPDRTLAAHGRAGPPAGRRQCGHHPAFGLGPGGSAGGGDSKAPPPSGRPR